MIERYILEDGRPVPCEDLITWGRWFEKTDRSVARTVVGDVDISTVFLGLDLGFFSDVPLLWETMIFGGPHDGNQWRYGTREEAEVGHAKAVTLVESSQPANVRTLAGKSEEDGRTSS